MTQPFVSTIIPSHNCAQYLEQAIHSIIDQNHSQLEIIVVDDGSTDDTASVVTKYPTVNYVYQANAGAAAARNRGIRSARGNLIAFLDADDLWMPGKLKTQLGVLSQQPDLDMVLGHVEEFHSPECDTGNKSRLRTGVPGYVPGTLLIKYDSFMRVGDFSTLWRLGEFMDWYLKAQEANLLTLMLPDVLLKRRLHDNNLGIRERSSQSDYAAIIKSALDRRRTHHPG